ncbi:MAG: 2-oxo acid dehydrogenase subunit E2 [Betaproteobacteria bacterium]|jgi:2-oxoglutarate dehydrogenase E2 component (dihydrolipoamide succinyltransferase)|nr:2-oxo acid dehydrogenase subunit E2 [Betaproteobacteria bacterium]
MDVVMPQLGETVTEGTVVTWHKKTGEAVKADELLFDVETDKVAMEVPAPAGGVLKEILVPEGETVAVGTRLAVIEVAGAAAAAASVPAAAATAARPDAPAVGARAAAARPDTAARGSAGEPPLSPVVRRLLAEHDLDPSTIKGTGRDGRITREDVLAAAGAGAKPTPATAPRPPERKGEGKGEVVPLTRIRKQIGAHMVRSKATSPHVLQAVEVDFHAVEAVRGARGKAWREREGFGLTYLPFIARAAIDAIAEFPRINASIDGDNLVVHPHVHLGIAVDLGFEGLMVPVIRDAQGKSVAELARAINAYADRARSGSIVPDDLAGGTYTISNSGPFGTLITAPIINQPQVAILSSDGVRKKPVVVESAGGDAIAIRPVGVIAQSFDHRAFDGAYSAAFLKRLREIIETQDWSGALG